MAAPVQALAAMEADDVKLGDNIIKRLMITKLVLENFKSYGGRKEIGMFHKVRTRCGPATPGWFGLFLMHRSLSSASPRLSDPTVRANPT